MSQIKTHLLTKDPVVFLIGRSTVLRTQMVSMLRNQHLQVVLIDSNKNIKENDVNLFADAYKIIWLHEFSNSEQDGYLEILKIFKELKLSITVITSVVTSLKSFKSDLLSEWKNRSDGQTQFIIDCNYHLPKASFIFGQDLVSSGAQNTSLEFLTQDIHKGIIVNPKITLSFIEVGDFIKSLKKYLFKPGKQNSVLIKGENIEVSLVISLLKKLYDSYHKTNIEVVSDSVKLNNTIPFPIKEIILTSNFRDIVTEVVKSLDPPQEEDNLLEVEKPDENLKRNGLSSESESENESVSTLNSTTTSVVTEVASITAVKVEDETATTVTIQSPQKEIVVDVDTEIQRIFQNSRTETKVGRIKKIVKSTEKITKKSKRRRVFFIGGIGVVGAAVGAIFLFIVFFISQLILKKELTAFISNGIVSQETIIIEDEGLRKITNFVDFQVEGYSSVIEADLITSTSSMINVSKELQSIPQILLEVDEASKNLVLQVLTGDINKTSELAQILDDKAQSAYESLSEIQASLNLIDFDIDSDNKESVILDYEKKIKEIRGQIAVQQQLQPILASLTGEMSKKTYAVILQNNQELRPTGGFIQAIALINFDEGSLVSYDVYSVYELDKKLSGAIIPPSDVMNYLGEEKWYLRDSNWNPDFPTTSRQIGWFINKILGVDIDGVIALNLFTVKDLLKVIGPIDLPEYNEVIAHKNILERMEFHSEVVLVNSANSTDYSVSIFEKLISGITNINREKIPSLLSSFTDSISDNQLFISVLEDSDQLVLHALGWTGGLVEPSCPAKLSLVECKVDAFSQVEANVGINKANYYLKRSISHEIMVDREKAIHKREITFKNNAKSNSWPKGTYKSYQRFYVDKNAKIDKILINGSALIEEQISQKESNGFKEIGIKVDVPIQKEVVVELEYSTPHFFQSGFSYVFFNRNQPGTSGDNLAVSMKYSEDIEPVLIAPAAEVYDRTIKFDTDLGSSLFSVEFE